MYYWRSYMQNRISRRRALATTGGILAGSAVLAACGNDSSGSKLKDPTGLLSDTPVTTARAKRGGTAAFSDGTALGSLDPLGNGTNRAILYGAYAYSRLLKYKVGTAENAPVGDVEGDAATEWEMAGDGLRLTFKLRRGMKFDARPPTNGRVLTTEDVKFSWARYSTLSPSGSNLSYAIEPSAPVESLTFPDSQTVVMKLAFPFAPILALIAYTWNLTIMPLEANGKFDPDQAMYGSGPWFLDRHEPSVFWAFKRNPDYYEAGRPFLDGIEYTVLPEYAAGLSQFEAGRLWAFAVNQVDILDTKRRHPKMVLTRAASFARNNPWVIGFGQLPGSPFHDVRLRQAISMMLDRDGMIEIEQSPSTFAKEGIPVEVGWHSHIGAGETKFWLNPQDEKQIGQGAKYFRYDVAEARKLLRAAGAENLETTFAYSAQSGSDPIRDSALGQLLRDGGLNSVDRPLNYANDYVPNYLRAHGMFPGLALLRGTTAPEIDGHLSAKLQPLGINSWIGLPIGGGAHELIASARKELDDQKRTGVIKDIQRILAMEMPAAPYGGVTKVFSLHWPWFGNKEAIASWQHPPSEEFPLLWYDEAQKAT